MLQCVFVYSVLWRNQMDLMYLTNPRSIRSIYARSVKTWATTVVVCRSSIVLLSSLLFRLLCSRHLMYVNSSEWVMDVVFFEKPCIQDTAHPFFTVFWRKTTATGEINRNYSSWQTSLADRKHECCQEVGLILSSKIQVEACISLASTCWVSMNKCVVQKLSCSLFM
jgi:hypothetical protein